MSNKFNGSWTFEDEVSHRLRIYDEAVERCFDEYGQPIREIEAFLTKNLRIDCGDIKDARDIMAEILNRIGHEQ